MGGTEATKPIEPTSVGTTSSATISLAAMVTEPAVLARSVFEHGVNYRSAMIYGTPRLLTDPEEKLTGLRCLTEHATPGQWDYARHPSRKELAATALLALSLDEASVKVRTGPRTASARRRTSRPTRAPR